MSPKTLLRPEPGRPPIPTVPRPDRYTLANGLRVVAVERPELPQIAARIVLPAGSVSDPVDMPGVASFVGALLTEGTERASAIDFNARLDALGASLTTRVGHDFAEVDLGLLAETLDEGLSFLAETLSSAAFPAREVERIRAETLDALDARLDEPANVADDRTGEALFGSDHPYGRLPVGTTEGVSGVTRERLIDFYHSRYRPDGSVLVIAGDFRPDELRRRLEAAFAPWSGVVPATPYPAQPTEPVAKGALVSVEWDEAAQGEIRVAGLGIPRNSADWVPAAVANYILGGSTITGRLGTNLREEKGWTYGVRAGFAAGVQPGGWIVETAVDAEVTEDALAEIEAELDRMVGEAVTDEELHRAREALVLSLPRAFETPSRIVSRLATVEAFGLPSTYWEEFAGAVQNVTADEIARVAAAYFAPDRLVRVAVGPRIEIPR